MEVMNISKVTFKFFIIKYSIESKNTDMLYIVRRRLSNVIV